jgi:hypothetical protein
MASAHAVRLGHFLRTLLALLVLEARKRERVRCSSLVDWPVYPRLRGTMLTTTPKRNPASKSNRNDADRFEAHAPGRARREPFWPAARGGAKPGSSILDSLEPLHDLPQAYRRA